MQVIDRGYHDAAGGYAGGRVLDILMFLNRGWRGADEPNGSCIHEKGPNKGYIGDKCGFLFAEPGWYQQGP